MNQVLLPPNESNYQHNRQVVMTKLMEPTMIKKLAASKKKSKQMLVHLEKQKQKVPAIALVKNLSS